MLSTNINDLIKHPVKLISFTIVTPKLRSELGSNTIVSLKHRDMLSTNTIVSEISNMIKCNKNTRNKILT